ncbi:TetR/AcrR family transcriptional regulator [uncultured Williamsia sp.]|uniref:TetR/AcrR family transcriptional regulator n=1 Tax=uncultured Williamsia sp. TaxID=259311 RepID=UPI00261B44C0|nr:TetR/AcrR family transcriptional regulator [uncultured Williamsia sp.]
MAARRTAGPTTPTGPRETKSERTRGRILDAAAHVLSIKGYSGTRLTDVAEYAELQAPAIYYYFPSREELIEEVMWVGIAEMREHVLAALDAADPDADAMDRIMVAVEAHLRHELEISDYTTASIRNSGQVPEQISARQKSEEALYGEVWRKLFKNAADAGMIRADLDQRVARMLVMGALNWAVEWWNPRRGSLDSVVASAQTLVRAGLSPSPSTAESITSADSPRTRASRTAASRRSAARSA